ncbi:MAG: hypothetical protein AAF530_17095 [Pseudomonadota bacterium]
MAAQTAWDFAPLLERFNQRTHQVPDQDPAAAPVQEVDDVTAVDEPDVVQEALEEKRRVEAEGKATYQRPSDLARSLEHCRTLALEFEGASLKSRASLYKALERAFAFSFECESDTTGFDALCEAHGIKRQARAPFTPVIKLVFGCKYDKSRISEYAACLNYAKRNKQTPETFRAFIEAQSGGVKGCAAAERSAANPKKPKSTKAQDAIKASLREAKPLATLEGPFDGKEEFVLLLARRTPGQPGQVDVIGLLEDKDGPPASIMKKVVQKEGDNKKASKQKADQMPKAETAKPAPRGPEARLKSAMSPRDEEHFKAAKSLAGPFDESRFAARYRLLYPQGDMSGLNPAAYCLSDPGPGKQSDDGPVKFLRRIDASTYQFVGLQGERK